MATNTIFQVERSVLSILMTCSDEEVVEETRLLLDPEDMSPVNRLILQALYAAHDATSGTDRSPAAIMTQARRIRVSPEQMLIDRFNELGVTIDMLNLIASTPTPQESIDEYVTDLLFEAQKSKLRIASVQMAKLAETHDPDMIESAEQIWNEFLAKRSQDDLLEGTELVTDVWNGLTGAAPMPLRFSMTGIPAFDNHSGIVGGGYYLIAMPTHDGKTQLALNVVAQAALNNGVFGPNQSSDVVFVYFAYEAEARQTVTVNLMSMCTGEHIPWVIQEDEVKRREIHAKRIKEILAYRSNPGIILQKYELKRRRGENVYFQEPTVDELLELKNAQTVVYRMKYKVLEFPRSTAHMRSVVQRLARKNPGKHIIAVLDYVQLATNGMDAYREVTYLSRNIKQSCLKDAGDKSFISWIVLSQFNRGQGTNSLKGNVKVSTWPRELLPLTALAESSSLMTDPDFIIHGLQNGRYLNGPEALAGTGDDDDWTRITGSVMKDRYMSEYPNVEFFVNRHNGFIANEKKLQRIC